MTDNVDDSEARRRERNQMNAQKSTGPKTEAGKARSGTNATRHGITAQRSIVTGESEEDWVAFCEELLSDLAPVGRLETELATRAAQLMWRLRRVGAAEANLWEPTTVKAMRKAEFGMWMNVESLGRYESHLNRQLNQTLHELLGWQNLRLTKDSHLLNAPDRSIEDNDRD